MEKKLEDGIITLICRDHSIIIDIMLDNGCLLMDDLINAYIKCCSKYVGQINISTMIKYSNMFIDYGIDSKLASKLLHIILTQYEHDDCDETQNTIRMLIENGAMIRDELIYLLPEEHFFNFINESMINNKLKLNSIQDYVPISIIEFIHIEHDNDHFKNDELLKIIFRLMRFRYYNIFEFYLPKILNNPFLLSMVIFRMLRSYPSFLKYVPMDFTMDKICSIYCFFHIIDIQLNEKGLIFFDETIKKNWKLLKNLIETKYVQTKNSIVHDVRGLDMIKRWNIYLPKVQKILSDFENLIDENN